MVRLLDHLQTLTTHHKNSQSQSLGKKVIFITQVIYINLHVKTSKSSKIIGKNFTLAVGSLFKYARNQLWLVILWTINSGNSNGLIISKNWKKKII